LAAQERRRPSEPILIVDSSDTLKERLDADCVVFDPKREEQGRLPRLVIHRCSAETEDDVHALFTVCKALMEETREEPVRILSLFHSRAEMPAPFGAAL